MIHHQTDEEIINRYHKNKRIAKILAWAAIVLSILVGMVVFSVMYMADTTNSVDFSTKLSVSFGSTMFTGSVTGILWFLAYIISMPRIEDEYNAVVGNKK